MKLRVTWSGKGMVTTYQPNGKTMVELGASVENTGGMVTVWNIHGEGIAQMKADEYGNEKRQPYNKINH